MIVKELIQIIEQMQAENNPKDAALLAFYRKKLAEVLSNAMQKAFA